MNRTYLVLISSLLVLAMMIFMVREPEQSARAGRAIIVFCAASNRAVIEEIRADYEKEFERTVQIQYGPSQTLLSSLEVSGTGDLYLPADESYLAMAREQHLIAEQIPLAQMRAVVAVPKGNPKKIATLADLLKPDVRIVQANPDAAAIGKITRRVLQGTGQWEPLEKATTAYRTTVSDVANDVVIGAADAGIVY
ncbi:MAG TPA: molybdate ABC transporter substrate-binding protein, partial [Planctomycetaceae bacterium]|nr:molybdate ABC transporter substrate-binding protein [Planctomycetaceae bacterium]